MSIRNEPNPQRSETKQTEQRCHRQRSDKGAAPHPRAAQVRGLSLSFTEDANPPPGRWGILLVVPLAVPAWAMGPVSLPGGPLVNPWACSPCQALWPFRTACSVVANGAPDAETTLPRSQGKRVQTEALCCGGTWQGCPLEGTLSENQGPQTKPCSKPSFPQTPYLLTSRGLELQSLS